jgi:predicted nucleotidyltransferase
VDRDAIPREKLIEEIRRFMQRVGVSEAIFFGSRERGDERPHSNLNLVLLDKRFEGRTLSKLLPELQRAWKIDVQLEMLPCSPEEFEEMQQWNTLAREAAQSGLRIQIEKDANEES